jgi:hypothetical protein
MIATFQIPVIRPSVRRVIAPRNLQSRGGDRVMALAVDGGLGDDVARGDGTTYFRADGNDLVNVTLEVRSFNVGAAMIRSFPVWAVRKMHRLLNAIFFANTNVPLGHDRAAGFVAGTGPMLPLAKRAMIPRLRDRKLYCWGIRP